MKRFTPALAALALLFHPALAWAGPLPADQVERIDQAARKALKDSGVPSVQVAVVKDGEIVLTRAWGKASETIAEARPDLQYQIASNSKQFLAALFLILENDGKLDLDDPVSKWLPELPGGAKITIRQLLSHTAGLQDYWPQDYSFAAMEQPVAPMDIVRRWGFKAFDYEPGTRWQYSNTGYVAAGLIAEKAGGAPLWQQFEARIFVPLGIQPVPMDDANGPAFPQGYYRNALGPVRPARPPARGWLWATGEFSMAAAELAKWDIARINRTLLPREDWEEMERPVRLTDGTSNGYGLGVYSRIADGRRVINHGGASVGFLSQNSVWLDDKVAIVVLTNGDFAGVQDDLTRSIAAIVLPKAGMADIGETAREADVRATLAAIRGGKFDPARFTENGRYFFNAQTLADYRESLAPLGPLTGLELARPPRLRGGFVNRVFTLKFGKKELTLITYAEAGAQGRWEQFIVSP